MRRILYSTRLSASGVLLYRGGGGQTKSRQRDAYSTRSLMSKVPIPPFSFLLALSLGSDRQHDRAPSALRVRRERACKGVPSRKIACRRARRWARALSLSLSENLPCEHSVATLHLIPKGRKGCSSHFFFFAKTIRPKFQTRDCCLVAANRDRTGSPPSFKLKLIFNLGLRWTGHRS